MRCVRSVAYSAVAVGLRSYLVLRADARFFTGIKDYMKAGGSAS